MEVRNLILASGSPRRKGLLEQIDIIPVISPNRIEKVVASSVPEQMMLRPSSQKVGDVMSRCSMSNVVLGADTVVAIDGVVLGRPENCEETYEMTGQIQGRGHQIRIGATILLREGIGLRQKHFTVKADVVMFPMTEEEIREHGEPEEPMDKAGAYAIQGRFTTYIQGISGDYSGVVGPPIEWVYQRLKALLEDREGESRD